MTTLDGLIELLEKLKNEGGMPGTSPVVIDVGEYLTEVEDVDQGGSDEGVVIWCGDRVSDEGYELVCEGKSYSDVEVGLFVEAVLQIHNFTLLRAKQDQDMSRIHEMCDLVMKHEK